MKTNRIENFFEFCKGNGKTAIGYKKNGKLCKKSFQEFLTDVEKMRVFIRETIPTKSNVVLFSFPYSYLFYVIFFASILSDIQIILIDSWKNKKKAEQMLTISNAEYAFIDSYTKYLSFLLPKKMKRVQMSQYDSCHTIPLDITYGTVITFTSGTTGMPKKIVRTIDFLFQQIDLLERNMRLKDLGAIYATLPMYAILSIFLGNTTFISKAFLKKQKPNTLLTSLNQLYRFKKRMPYIHKCYIGGTILYSHEVKFLQSILPYADISYIYGASEGVLIYKTDLIDYAKNLFTFSTEIDGVKVSLKNTDKNQVGEIIICGDVVLGDNEVHATGDLGIFTPNGLKIVGRKKYSHSEIGFYNYLVDEEIRSENKKIKRAFSFFYNNKIYCVYNGTISKRKTDYCYIHLKKMPMDLKHKTKLDYSAVINKLKKIR